MNKFFFFYYYNYNLLAYVHRLIKHTKQLLEENEERLCIKVLQTLREMMTKDRGYGEKVGEAAKHRNDNLTYFMNAI